MHYIILFCFISFMFIPTISYAENYTIKERNQSITIVINPSNVIVKPTNVTVKPNNTIIVQQPTISKTEGDKPEKSFVTYDQIFGGSATVAGLFSIGLFATTRFSEGTRAISAPLLQASVTLSGFIIILHVLIMLILVLGLIFNTMFYVAVMSFTIFSVAAISGFIGKIIIIENRMNRTIKTTEDDINKKFKVKNYTNLFEYLLEG